jgi:hypothetical protein
MKGQKQNFRQPIMELLNTLLKVSMRGQTHSFYVRLFLNKLKNGQTYFFLPRPLLELPTTCYPFLVGLLELSFPVHQASLLAY